MAAETGLSVSPSRASRRFSAMDATALFDFFVPKACVNAALDEGVAVICSSSLSSLSLSGTRTVLLTVIFFASTTLSLFDAGSKTAM